MKKILFALAAVVMLAPACTQDLTEGQNGTNVKMKKVTFGVTFEQPEIIGEDGTRITLDDKKQFVWEEGDVVNVVYSYPYTTTNADGSTSNKTGFKVSAAEIDGGFVGMPVDEVVMLDFELPAEDNYTVHYAYSSKCQVDQLQDYRLRPRCSVQAGDGPEAYDGNTYAAYKESDFDKLIRDCFATGPVNVAEKTITLRNSAAFLQVQLTGNGEAVWSVDVLSKSQNLRARYCYVNNPATDNPTFAVYQNLEATSESSSAMGGAHCNTSGETLSDAPKSYYFAMPVQDFPAGDLFIQVRTGNYTRLYRASKAHSFVRNHVTVLKPIEVKPIDTDAHDYQPLDADGLSNCYMVAPSNEDKYYSFPIKNVNGATEIYNGKTKNYGVWPMWATKDGLVEDISVVYGGGNGADGRVFFKVPAGTGNGSCMLTGGPINSTLIGTNWAWHIWVTDAHAVTYGDPAITVLDRAPGALWVPTSKEEVVAMTGETAAQTVGFMYQYGRHNAFPGPKNLGDKSLSNKWGYEGAGGSSSKSRFGLNTMAVEFYHFARWQNGFTVYGHTNKTIVGAKYYNMSMMQMGGTWATDVTQATINADGTTGNKDLWSTAEKGNQDPCPQGYRVAGITEVEKLLRAVRSDVALYMDHYSPSKKTYSKVTTANRYAADAYGSFANGEYGTVSKATREELLNGNFVWFPHGGIRMLKQNSPDADEGGTMLYATSYMHDGETVLSPGFGIIWGVPDYDFSALYASGTKVTQTFIPSHATSSYPNYTCIPIKWVRPGENVWTLSTLNQYVEIKRDDASATKRYTQGGLPAHDAAPVRCVKLPTASGDAQVSSLAAKQTDANAWN